MNNTHFHRRNLPHFYSPNSTYFITYRLKGSIPLSKLKEMKESEDFNKDYKSKAEKYLRDKKFFTDYDNLLDNNQKIQHLKNPKIAEIVKNTLNYPDKKDYNLICYTIMPYHVHLVFHLLENAVSSQSGLTVLQKANYVSQTIQSEKISNIMKSIKGISAREANKVLNRKGSFWQTESYDHIVRDEDELERIIKYIISNPVKAGLVEKWQDWQYTYMAEEWW